MTDPEPVTGRPPQGWQETLTANSRPQPAIPALLVLVLAIIIPVLSLQPGEVPDHSNASWIWLLVPLAILSSSGLAVAAGFCSVFPQLIWIAVATWALKFTLPGGPLPAYNRYVFLLGILACAAMFVFQIHRVRSGQFVPTIVDEDPETDI